MRGEEGLGLFLVGNATDQEDKIVRGKVLAVVSVFLEENGEPLPREDGFEEVEVFAEEQEVLDVELASSQ